MGKLEDHSFRRYYLYKVTNPGENSTVHYLGFDDGGSFWSDDIEDAYLFKNLSQASDEGVGRMSPDYIMNVGQVFVDINRMFSIVTLLNE